MGDCRRGCHACLDVCPFLEQSDNEDTLAQARFDGVAGIRHAPETGFYLNSYAGYAAGEQDRARGASGGLARWFLAALLRQGAVNRVICVTAGDSPDALFTYRLFDDPGQLTLAAAKSAYYPVEMSGVMDRVIAEDARYAVIAVPCFLTGLALAQRQNRWLRERVCFTAGLVCGQTKTRGFTEYLIRKAGQDPRTATAVSFREKQEAPASNFRFAATGPAGSESLPFAGPFGQAYTTGQFKLNCCEFCDDVFAEVADIVFMDAWLPEYVVDSRGTNLVITRSPLAESVLQGGVAAGEVHLQPLDLGRVIESQDSCLLIKRTLMPYRLYMADRAGEPRPPKRVAPIKPPWIVKRWLIVMKRLRVASFEQMLLQQQASPTGLDVYEPAMRNHLDAYFRWKRRYYTIHGRWQAAKRRLAKLFRRDPGCR